jgi:uncharacterized protein (TIGR02147 family)
MISVYDFDNPVTYIRNYIKQLPAGQKRGAYNRMAKSAGIFPSYLSQILKGERQLNADQSISIADYMKLNEFETRYFLRISDLSRAQTKKLKEQILKELEEIKATHHQIAKSVDFEKIQLSPQNLEKFYSSWMYIAARLLVAVPGHADVFSISQRLGISEIDAKYILNFLVRTGLCVSENTKLKVGPMHTHLEQTSPLIAHHHANWRLKAMNKHHILNPTKELAYSLALTLSKKDAVVIRGMILELVKNLRSISDPSPPETLYAFNLDWFEV